jgi:hypothetical protein
MFEERKSGTLAALVMAVEHSPIVGAGAAETVL